MKKFILAVLPLFYFILLCFPPTVRADASSHGYACVLSDETYFYSSENADGGLFILPRTYYVKVLEIKNPYTKVEYLTDGATTRKLVGYCKTAELTFVDYVPQTPYLYHFFDVTYTAEHTGGSGDGFLNTVTLTCAYYGDYFVGSTAYAYVLQNDGFGYVPRPASLTYPENTEYAERNAPTDKPSDGAEEEPSSNPAQIAILVVLCLLAPILAAIVLRSSRKKPYNFEE